MGSGVAHGYGQPCFALPYLLLLYTLLVAVIHKNKSQYLSCKAIIFRKTVVLLINKKRLEIIDFEPFLRVLVQYSLVRGL